MVDLILLINCSIVIQLYRHSDFQVAVAELWIQLLQIWDTCIKKWQSQAFGRSDFGCQNRSNAYPPIRDHYISY